MYWLWSAKTGYCGGAIGKQHSTGTWAMAGQSTVTTFLKQISSLKDDLHNPFLFWTWPILGKCKCDFGNNYNLICFATDTHTHTQPSRWTFHFFSCVDRVISRTQWWWLVVVVVVMIMMMMILMLIEIVNVKPCVRHVSCTTALGSIYYYHLYFQLRKLTLSLIFSWGN